MNTIRSLSLLRIALLLDAVASGVMGAALVTLSAWLAPLLHLPADLLSDAGWVLVPYALCVGALGLRNDPAPLGVWIVIGINVLWAIDSIVLLFTGWVAPNLLGQAFVIAQAAAVAVFAHLQFLGLRRGRALAS